MHVAARRHRADDIGDREDRRLARRAVERRDEAVVAIFLVRGIDVGFSQSSAANDAAVDELRIVDLEPGRQTVDEEQPRRLRRDSVTLSTVTSRSFWRTWPLRRGVPSSL